MPEYNVHWTGYVSHVETVEADSAEEAMDAAQEGWVSLCNQCTREWDSAGDPEVFTVTDADGNTAWEANPVRPLPTREQIDKLVSDWFRATLQPIVRDHLADAIEALFTGGKE